MSVSRLQLLKTETRDFAERDRLDLPGAYGRPTEWGMTNARFFSIFVAIAGVLAVVALIGR